MNKSPKKLLGMAVKILISTVVTTYLGIHSYNFFSYTFPKEQWYLAYLGFGLTSGGVIGCLIIFLYDAETSLQKMVSLVMLLISVIGEVATAGFGMQIEAMENSGYMLTESDFSFMMLAVQALGFMHAIGMLLYFAGDEIAVAFSDEPESSRQSKNSNSQQTK